MPIAAAPAWPAAASTRTKMFFAGRPNESTTFPPTASWASALALNVELFGSLPQLGVLGTAVSAPGNLAVGSSHFWWPSLLASLLLVREAAVPAGSLSAPFGSVLLHPASTSTAANTPAPTRRMTRPSPPVESRPPAQSEQLSVRQNETPAYHSASYRSGQGEVGSSPARAAAFGLSRPVAAGIAGATGSAIP